MIFPPPPTAMSPKPCSGAAPLFPCPRRRQRSNASKPPSPGPRTATRSPTSTSAPSSPPPQASRSRFRASTTATASTGPAARPGSGGVDLRHLQQRPLARRHHRLASHAADACGRRHGRGPGGGHVPLRVRRRHALPADRHHLLRLDPPGRRPGRADPATPLAAGPFNKMRMCVFPKSYLFNENEPELYPFEGSLDGGFDYERPNPAFYRHLETAHRPAGRTRHRGGPDPLPRLRPLGLLHHGPRGRRPLRQVRGRPAGRRTGTSGGRWPTNTTCCSRRPPRTGSASPASCRRTTPAATCCPSTTAATSTTTPGRGSRTPASSGQDVLQDRRDDRRVAGPLAEAGGHRRVRLRRQHRPGLGQHHRRGDDPAGSGKVPSAAATSATARPTCTPRTSCGGPRAASCTAPAPTGSRFLRRILAESARRIPRARCPAHWDVPTRRHPDEYELSYFGFNQPTYRRFVMPAGPDVSGRHHRHLEHDRGNHCPARWKAGSGSSFPGGSSSP